MRLVQILLVALGLSLAGYYLFSPPAEEREDGRVVIEFVYPGTPSEAAIYRKQLARFEETHPGIKVKEIHPTTDINILQKIQIMLGGDVPPDVCWLDVGTVYQFAKYGGLSPLDDFIRADCYDLSDFQPQKFLLAATYDGKLYGLPNGLNCLLTFFNEDAFRRAGLPTPEELAARGQWTWEKFLEVGLKLSDRKKKVFSHDVGFTHPWMLCPVLESYGERLVDLEKKKCYTDSPTCVRLLQMFKDFIYRYNIRPMPDQMEAIRGDTFMSGQVAMTFLGRWLVPKYAAGAKFKWGVAPLPAGPLGSRTPLVGDFYCIPRKARHPREAWELVKFLCGPEGQRISAAGGLLIPSRRSVALSDVYLKCPLMAEKYNRVFVDELYNHGVLLPIDEHWNQWASDLYDPGLASAFADRESIEDAVKRLKPRVEEVLREGD